MSPTTKISYLSARDGNDDEGSMELSYLASVSKSISKTIKRLILHIDSVLYSSPPLYHHYQGWKMNRSG
ncbi:unnamed protein product [Linum trigynum]|uniref:Uncharacterized protein n=1 Tax=Linum trigynum TaxID=586398 RepID=A0AAV2E2Z8_9ROSI